MAKYLDSEVLKVVLTKERTSMNVTNGFLKTLCECDSFEDRVRMIQSQLPCNWLSTPAETLEKYQKNTGVSRTLRLRGNGKFKTKDFEDALESYNLAVMFAKTTDEELGLAYANRSAVLVEMQDYEGALEDIELAINHNYPIALADKLQTRRSRCDDLILKRNEDDIHKKVLAEVEERKLLREKMLKIEANPLMPSAASCVEIKRCSRIAFQGDSLGRHLIVNQDVPAATVLSVENPYAAVLRGELDWETNYCHYCLRRIRRGIPCGVCVFVIYCDEACKLKAYQEFHQRECRCLPQLHCNSASARNYMLLSFRMLCKVGPKELVSLFVTREPEYFMHSGSYETDENCKYDSDAYLSVHHLKMNSKHLDALKLYNNTLLAFLWTEVLDTETDFFQGVPGLSTPVGIVGPTKLMKEFKNFVAAFMLRHIELIPLNFSAIGELAGLENLPLSSFYNGQLSEYEIFQKIDNSYLAPYAYGIYPVFSLITHSCDGNTIRLNDVSRGTCIVITKRRLKAGETLSTNYGMHHTSHAKMYRQSYLRERYYFNCQCTACELDWPQMMNLDLAIRFCCPSCSKKDRGHDGCRESEKYQLAGPNWKCPGCGRRYREEYLLAKFNSNAETLHNIGQSVCHNDPCQAMKRLKGVMDYFQYHVCSPTREEYFAQKAFLTRAVALILRYAESSY